MSCQTLFSRWQVALWSSQFCCLPNFRGAYEWRKQGQPGATGTRRQRKRLSNLILVCFSLFFFWGKQCHVWSQLGDACGYFRHISWSSCTISSHGFIQTAKEERTQDRQMSLWEFPGIFHTRVLPYAKPKSCFLCHTDSSQNDVVVLGRRSYKHHFCKGKQFSEATYCSILLKTCIKIILNL